MLIVIALFGFYWGAFAQTLSLKMQNVSVKKAMTELEAQSGYSFVYIAGDIDTERVVSVDAEDLKEAIDQILRGQAVSYEIQGDRNIVVSSNHSRQIRKQKVNGRVKDINGEPIIGANVSFW